MFCFENISARLKAISCFHGPRKRPKECREAYLKHTGLGLSRFFKKKTFQNLAL